MQQHKLCTLLQHQPVHSPAIVQPCLQHRQPLRAQQQQQPQHNSREPPHPHHHQQHDQDQQLLWLQQQRTSSHPLQHQHQQHQYQPPPNAPLPPVRRRHKQRHSASLAAALYVTPAQARSMVAAYPALANYSHRTLAYKLQELSDMLQVSPQQLGPALSTAPKVLGFSLHQVEQQLMALSWIQPDRQLLAEMILRAPMLLTWRARQLQTRTDNMAAALGISTHRMAGLLQQHPMLLPASSHLRQTLQLLQQLFLLAAASEQAGFGTGVVATLVKAGSQQQHVATPPGLDRYQQQQQVGPAADAAVLAAARQFALSHPRVLLMAPQELQARVASMQATSGLPAAQVAAMLISQPGLLLEERHV